MRKKEIRVRCWVDIDGVKFFGLGRAELLMYIDKTGSISEAARAMGMSYKKAWNMIDELNQLGQRPYVLPRTGGQKGGGAEVTDTGKKVLNAYGRLNEKINALVSKEKVLLKLI